MLKSFLNNVLHSLRKIRHRVLIYVSRSFRRTYFKHGYKDRTKDVKQREAEWNKKLKDKSEKLIARTGSMEVYGFDDYLKDLEMMDDIEVPEDYEAIDG